MRLSFFQLKKLIRKKHTLPNYKMRSKPFFTGLSYIQNPYAHTSTSTPSVAELAGSDSLSVTVNHCTRLLLDEDLPQSIFCILYTCEL